MHSGLGDSLSLARRAGLLQQGPGNPKKHSKGSSVQTLMEWFTWSKTVLACYGVIFSTDDDRDALSCPAHQEPLEYSHSSRLALFGDTRAKKAEPACVLICSALVQTFAPNSNSAPIP